MHDASCMVLLIAIEIPGTGLKMKFPTSSAYQNMTFPCISYM